MRKLLMICLIASLILLTGCSQTIEEIKTEENIGKTVSVKGTVKNTIKLGDLSGYSLEDENGDTIGVVSKKLPAEEEKITVKGTLEKKPILGYYINVDK